MASHVYALMLGGPRGLSKLVISRVMIGVNAFRVPITLLITYLLSPLGLQAPQTPNPLDPEGAMYRNSESLAPQSTLLTWGARGT